MEKAKITFDVVQAKNLTPFTLADGTRHLGFHYFYLKNDEWQFLWVEKNTDPEWLQEKIEAGLIYVFDF